MNLEKLPFTADDNHLFELSPARCLSAMLEHTDSHGILYLPEWPVENRDGRPGKYFRCRMKWKKSDCDRLLAEFEKLVISLKELAPRAEELEDEKTSRKLLPPALFRVWSAYVRDFRLGEFNAETLESITEKIAEGREISREEQVLFDTYVKTLNEECRRRVGKGPAAYDVVLRGRRVCLLAGIEAPQVVMNHEENLLIQAMALHRCAKEIKIVDTVE